MANSPFITATTNDRPDSCVDVKCNCQDLWSLSQQFCYTRLSNKKLSNKSPSGQNHYCLINDLPARARRIAGTYARFYLETEEHGDRTKKGRYYWMALGAFASKTVACALESWQVAWRPLGDTVHNALGQGNFWLFNDIAAWHWYYNVSPNSFSECLDKRDVNSYVDTVKTQMKKLPWAEQSLPKINNLKMTAEVKKGFELVKDIERSTVLEKRRADQLAHLLVMAIHEQKHILQNLIYNNTDFKWWIQVQRGEQDMGAGGRAMGMATSLFSPPLKISFVSACDTDLPEYSNVASADIKLEDYKSRMKWIEKVAKLFHGLMINHSAEMEGHLRTIAGWYDTPDAVIKPDEAWPSPLL